MRQHAASEDFDSESDAVSDFIAAVVKEYNRRDNRWRIRRETNAPDPPDYLALLAAEVLAAFHVGDSNDPEGRGDSFWTSFRDLVGDAATQTPQFYDDQETAWRDLDQWANFHNGRRHDIVRIPPIERRQGNRWFVNLAYSQCLLRITDLDQLTKFFKSLHLQPGDADDRARISRLVKNHAARPDWFTRHAQRVLASQDRFEPALDQIADYLKAWNGSSMPQRSAAIQNGRTIELSVDKQGGRQRVAFRLFDTESENATDPLTYEQTSRMLGARVIEDVSVNGMCFRPRATDYLLAVKHQAINRFITVNRLRPGEHFRLIVHLHDRRRWEPHIESFCETGSVGIFSSSQRTETGINSLKGLPTDWILLEGKVRDNVERVAEPWRSIFDGRSPQVLPLGGLKLGRNTWQSGAGPRLSLSSVSITSKLFINDLEVQIPKSPMFSNPLLDTPGVYYIAMNRDEKRCRQIRIQIRDSVLTSQHGLSYSWITNATGWPTVAVSKPDTVSQSVLGMSVGSEWGKCQKDGLEPPNRELMPARRAAIMALLSGPTIYQTPRPDDIHPLIRLMDSISMQGLQKRKARDQQEGGGRR